MAEIKATMVKELRERTGLGMMECKKALVEAAGDIGVMKLLFLLVTLCECTLATARTTAGR